MIEVFFYVYAIGFFVFHAKALAIYLLGMDKEYSQPFVNCMERTVLALMWPMLFFDEQFRRCMFTKEMP